MLATPDKQERDIMQRCERIVDLKHSGEKLFKCNQYDLICHHKPHSPLLISRERCKQEGEQRSYLLELTLVLERSSFEI